MQPIQVERSLDLNNLNKYSRTAKFLLISKLNLISQKRNLVNRIYKKNWAG